MNCGSVPEEFSDAVPDAHVSVIFAEDQLSRSASKFHTAPTSQPVATACTVFRYDAADAAELDALVADVDALCADVDAADAEPAAAV